MRLAGIDSGGTSCRLVLCAEDGTVLSACRVPGHNPNADGFGPLEQSLRQGLQALLAPLGGQTPDALHLGAAGGSGENGARLKALLQTLLPGCRVSVSTDALIALSSGLGRRDGGVLIAGTGTVGFLRQGTALRRFGGWGWMVDEGGSGWHIGRDGFRAAMAGEDSGLPETCLTQLYEEHFGMPMARALTALYRERLPLADCAPLVFAACAQGDAAAEQILRHNAACLAQTLGRMAEAFGGRCPVVLVGGLLREGSAYLTLLREQTRALPLELILPPLPPVYGAACLAAEQAGLPETEAFARRFAATYQQFTEGKEQAL